MPGYAPREEREKKENCGFLIIRRFITEQDNDDGSEKRK